jgi:hypothetical protein
MKMLSPILMLVIAACIVMFCYLMLYLPYACRNPAVRTGGTASCGWNWGAYGIAAMDCIIAAGAAFRLIHR